MKKTIDQFLIEKVAIGYIVYEHTPDFVGAKWAFSSIEEVSEFILEWGAAWKHTENKEC